MSTLTHLLDKFHHPQLDNKAQAQSSRSKISMKRIGELGWGITTFLLFLALGPFSAVAAVCGVMSLAKNGEFREPEAV